MKVSEICYKRIDSEKLCKKIFELANKAEYAKSAKELALVRSEYLTEQFHFATAESLSHMRFTLNTQDAFYNGEMNYYDEVKPLVQAASVKFQRKFLASAYLKGVTEFINPLVIKQYELSVQCVDDKIVPLLIEENKLVTQYTHLMAETTFEFNRKKMTLAELKRYFSERDRLVRKAAYEAAGKTLASISAELDKIFDRLVKVRTEMAQKLGYRNYVALGDNRMGRISYNRKMIAAFRENVKNDLVPLIRRLKDNLGKKIGAQPFMLYDNDTYFLEGNAEPALTPNEMFEVGKNMYAEMSDETGEFFSSMLCAEAFDVFPKKGKWGGGYCTSFIDYKQPFILANFNGTGADVDVLTHEAGHAFADYMMYKLNHDIELNVGGMETAETHSMSMEFFCYKTMDTFFGSRGNDYRFQHLFDSLSFIPYGIIVDYFQQLNYENPHMTPAERNALWLKLEGEFRPYLSADGIPYLQNGTRWQYQMHIYECPLYYIDYCLAQSVAMQFLLESQKDYQNAFNRYFTLLKQGGEKEFPALVAEAGLNSPFAPGALKQVATDVEILLNKLNK